LGVIGQLSSHPPVSPPVHGSFAPSPSSRSTPSKSSAGAPRHGSNSTPVETAEPLPGPCPDGPLVAPHQFERASTVLVAGAVFWTPQVVPIRSESRSVGEGPLDWTAVWQFVQTYLVIVVSTLDPEPRRRPVAARLILVRTSSSTVPRTSIATLVYRTSTSRSASRPRVGTRIPVHAPGPGLACDVVIVIRPAVPSATRRPGAAGECWPTDRTPLGRRTVVPASSASVVIPSGPSVPNT
jgi:hypothetical protein